jgi:hypothetical protein
VNDLIFDLAAVDRNLSQEYLKKIRIKTTPVVLPQSAKSTAPTAETAKTVAKEEPKPTEGKAPIAEPMKRGTPPATPPLLRPSSAKATEDTQGFGGQAAGGMKQGTPPPPPGGMKKPGNAGGPPPPPGPMIKKGKNAPAQKGQAAPVVPKGPDPLTITGSYSAGQLAKRSNEEIIELFNKLLDALGTNPDFWDAAKKEPKLDWNNKISTAKKALMDQKRNLALNGEQMIKDRIQQVRIEKAQQGLEKQNAAQMAEKKVEKLEYTQEELVAKIDALKKRMDPSDFKWLIEFQGNIKKLDKINHEKAAEYEAEFIKKFPGQKLFLPKKKEAEVKKELTEEEKIISNIEKILSEKPNFWAVKVREPIQELYDINSVRGLEYQDKYIAATKEATGKADKPFLRLK